MICREHKEQMDAFLDGDAQLKAEVEYDIRRYEVVFSGNDHVIALK